MKKYFILLCVTLLSLSAQAQQKGDFALGVHGGVTFGEVKFGNLKEDVSQWGAGLFAQYNFANHWRAELEGTYHFEKNHSSDILLGLNVHYLFNLTEQFTVYPILGYGVAFVHNDTFREGSVTVEEDDSTDGGIQLGVGLQLNLDSNWFLSGEYKYQPGIFGDGHVVMAGIGYTF